MTGSAWEPTEPQSGVDPNMFNLIDPEQIPYPNTGTVSLGWAAVDLFTASSEICEDSEGLESTWQGLQAHYSSPDDERLFAAMGPLATAGDTLAGDLGTVAMALEEFAEAASTAQTALGRLRSQAWTLYDKHKDAYVWWTEVPEDVVENQRIKSEVNAAWAAFTEAETTCANAIAALCGGPEYVAPDEATEGADEIVYGMPTDLEEAPEPGTFAFFRTGAGDYLDWGLRGEKPWPLDWAGALGRTGWETLGWGAVGDIGVAAASLSGFWSAGGGWTLDVRERRTNQDAFLRETAETVGGYGGLHGDDGWIIEPWNGEGLDDWDGQEWRANFDEGIRELGHNYVPYSEWDDDPAYVTISGTFNVGTMVVGAPLRILDQIVDASRPGVPTDSSGGRYDSPFSSEGGGSGGGSQEASGNRDPGASPSERFGDAIDDLDLPTDRGPHGPTTPTDPGGPSGPSEGPGPSSGPAPNGPSPEAPHSPSPDTGGGSGGGSGSSGNGRTGTGDDGTGDGSGRDRDDNEGSESGRERDEEGAGSGRDSDNTSTQDNGTPPTRPREEDSSPRNDQDDGSSQRRDDHQQDGTRPREEQRPPDPATGGGRGDDGGNQPPRDRTGTGDDSRGDSGDGSDGNSSNRPRDEESPSEQTDGGAARPDPEGISNKEPTQSESDRQRPSSDTPVAPDGEGDLPKPMPEDPKRGHILEQIGEDRVTRDPSGLIDTVDGRNVTDYLRGTIDQRDLDTQRLVQETPLSKADLGKRGAVQSLVIDRRTGNLVEAINGRKYDTIDPVDLHPLLKGRLEALYRGGPYQLYQKQQPWQMHPTRMNDEPLRHAEIKAVNELLWARKVPGRDASVLRDFQLDNSFTNRKVDKIAPCCPNCTSLIPGVRNPTAGRRVEAVQGLERVVEYDE